MWPTEQSGFWPPTRSRSSSARCTPNRCSCSAQWARLYHFSRQEFGRAACWGLLVGLTRLNGALLAAPLALHRDRVLGAARENGCVRRRGRARHRPGDLRALHLESHRQSLRVRERPDGVGQDLQWIGNAGGPAVLDSRQRRLERLRRRSRLRRATMRLAPCSPSPLSGRSPAASVWLMDCSW